ncbi:hypothetical protein CUMW_148580 [Citrus unshiu]|uniref:RING-type E3 ubiquitin transferase n=1 Tax=Citrus unshiu TaxID=55188 RepID=A0A2H5PLV8_CITUN|nr:hypothetical protein CUMW_148580 [Citrus unshiu]
MPVPLPAPFDHHHRGGGGGEPGQWRYPCGPMMAPPPPYVEHQKAVTIRNDVNLKKESLKLEADEENPGKLLVSFTFDATVAGRCAAFMMLYDLFLEFENAFFFLVGKVITFCLSYLDLNITVSLASSITVVFFAKEGEDCNLAPTKENLFAPVTVQFQRGLGQKFRQPSGTGIDFSMFEETELLKEGNMDVYPLAVKADASPVNQNGSDGNSIPGPANSQITQAVFEKEKGEYQVRVVKQILWVNGMRYELQEIYGIGNSVDGDVDANDPGKECVICLSEPRDTTVLPCRHMCMCSGCAKVLRFQTNRCPICRQPVERLLEIKVNGPEE